MLYYLARKTFILFNLYQLENRTIVANNKLSCWCPNHQSWGSTIEFHIGPHHTIISMYIPSKVRFHYRLLYHPHQFCTHKTLFWPIYWCEYHGFTSVFSVAPNCLVSIFFVLYFGVNLEFLKYLVSLGPCHRLWL